MKSPFSCGFPMVFLGGTTSRGHHSPDISGVDALAGQRQDEDALCGGGHGGSAPAAVAQERGV